MINFAPILSDVVLRSAQGQPLTAEETVELARALDFALVWPDALDSYLDALAERLTPLRDLAGARSGGEAPSGTANFEAMATQLRAGPLRHLPVKRLEELQIARFSLEPMMVEFASDMIMEAMSEGWAEFLLNPDEDELRHFDLLDTEDDKTHQLISDGLERVLGIRTEDTEPVGLFDLSIHAMRGGANPGEVPAPAVPSREIVVTLDATELPDDLTIEATGVPLEECLRAITATLRFSPRPEAEGFVYDVRLSGFLFLTPSDEISIRVVKQDGGLAGTSQAEADPGTACAEIIDASSDALLQVGLRSNPILPRRHAIELTYRHAGRRPYVVRGTVPIDTHGA